MDGLSGVEALQFGDTVVVADWRRVQNHSVVVFCIVCRNQTKLRVRTSPWGVLLHCKVQRVIGARWPHVGERKRTGGPERFNKYYSRFGWWDWAAVFLGSGFVSAQLQAAAGMLLRQDLARIQESSLKTATLFL